MPTVAQRKQALHDTIDKHLGPDFSAEFSDEHHTDKRPITGEELRAVLHEMVDHLVVEPEHHRHGGAGGA